MTRRIDEAVERARRHLQSATLEGLEAARALIDLARSAPGSRSSAPGHPGDGPTGPVEGVGRAFEPLIAGLRDGRTPRLPARLATPLAEALEIEIARWSRRARGDPDARLVLGVLLGLRELVDDTGPKCEGTSGRATRRRPDSKRTDSRHEHRPGPEGRAREARPRARRGPRVQRFEIED